MAARVTHRCLNLNPWKMRMESTCSAPEPERSLLLPLVEDMEVGPQRSVALRTRIQLPLERSSCSCHEGKLEFATGFRPFLRRNRSRARRHIASGAHSARAGQGMEELCLCTARKKVSPVAQRTIVTPVTSISTTSKTSPHLMQRAVIGSPRFLCASASPIEISSGCFSRMAAGGRSSPMPSFFARLAAPCCSCGQRARLRCDALALSARSGGASSDLHSRSLAARAHPAVASAARCPPMKGPGCRRPSCPQRAPFPCRRRG
jgi:hypothetical protein